MAQQSPKHLRKTLFHMISEMEASSDWNLNFEIKLEQDKV